MTAMTSAYFFLVCFALVAIGLPFSTAEISRNQREQIRAAHRCGDPSIGPVLGGVDLVALRKQYEATQSFPKLPLLGSREFNTTFGSYHFLFSNDENRNTFVAQPEEYIPQLGGYCSWGLTGYDIHVSDPSGYMLAGSCLNSTNGFSYLKSQNQLQNFWYLLEEAKIDLEQTGESVDANIAAARANFDIILQENGVSYCFNTDKLRTCE